MRTQGETRTVAQTLLVELAVFDYLTASQAARLLAKDNSLTYIREQFRSLVRAKLALALDRHAVNIPWVYTLTTKGREYAGLLRGTPADKRFRPAEEHDKAQNAYFIRHTAAVTDVLIAARLLAKNTPGITLNRLFTERALKRKISVQLPQPPTRGRGKARTVCIEPDASLDFTITETWHAKPQTWQDFFHIEVYRNLPPAEWRFKQKIAGYVTLATTGQQNALFQTPALSVAVFAATDTMAQMLKTWTEETLAQHALLAESNRFFFWSSNPATAHPTEIFLSPVWESAFGTAKTPLLVLGEEP
jgi:hypothetical protein